MARHNWVEDMAFIVGEINRLGALKPNQIQEEDPNAVWHMVPAPDGRGSLFLGSKGGQRLARLAADYISRQPEYSGRLSLDAGLKHLRGEVSRAFIGRRENVDQAHVQSTLHRAVTKAAVDIQDRTHFIPCHIVSRDEPDEFSIGPVRFVSRRRLESEIRPGLDAFRASIVDDRNEKYPKLDRYKDASPAQIKADAEKFASHFIDAVASYFGEFRWVAEVKVLACDSKVSRWRGHRAAAAAIDAVRLFTKPGYADRMRAGGRTSAHPNSTRLLRDASGQLRITVCQGAEGEPVAEHWWSDLSSSPPTQIRLEAIGKAIDTVVNPGPPLPLSRRFLDALGWFGAACTDDQPAAKLVKFVTAIERVVLTPDERDEIQMKIVERGAAHAFDRNAQDLEEWIDRLNKIYDCRSRLVHGAISPYDPRVIELYYEASIACHYILMRGLDFFCHLGLDARQASNRKFRKSYELLLKNACSLNEGGPAVRIPPL